MRRAILFLFISMFVNYQDARAEAPQKNDGAPVSRQESGNVTEPVRDGCEALLDMIAGKCREYLRSGYTSSIEDIDQKAAPIFMARSCSQPLLKDRLTDDEKKGVKELVLHAKDFEKGFSKEEAYQIEMWASYAITSRCE